MQTIRLVLAATLACALASGVAVAQEGAGSAQESSDEALEAGTGDDWIDARLRDMDAYAARHRDAFIDEIVRYLEAPRPLLDEALTAGGMRPGDVYYACALARASGRACRTLVDAWLDAAGAGWESVAEQLELELGTKLHPRIREDIGASYRRWARPID
ncbi:MULTISPECIES: hypothetical protein [unclassified Luteimonas]